MDRPVVRLAVFAVGLVASFGAAFGLGRAVGPIGDDATPSGSRGTTTTMVHGGHP